jgi:outer membrane receptor protein involved in Fe transport
LISTYLSVSFVNAQGLVLEEVIVTAQLRAESLQDVPLSVNAVYGDKLMEAGIMKIEDLQSFVPNLTMSETGIGNNIYIRGIGSGINQGFEQSVGMYIDGVYYGRAQLSRTPFLDLDRVEVLRGPQNILYGKNSIAGAMSITTAKPHNEFEGMLGLTLEPEYGDQVFDLMLNGPLTETLSARFAHRSRQFDGYVENLDASDEPERDEVTSRLSLQWEPTANFDAGLKFEKGSFDVTGRQLEIVGDEASLNPSLAGANWSEFLYSLSPTQTPISVLNTSQDFKRSSNGDFSNNNTENVTLTMNYDLNDFVLTSITSTLKYDYHELCDCDFTGADIFFVESEEEYKQFSQEFRITSPGGETIDWIAGLYYQTSELDFTDSFFTTPDSILNNVLEAVLPVAFSPDDGVTTTYPSGASQQLIDFSVPRVFEQDSDLFSVFLQATWNINDRSRLTVGGRYSNEEKEASRALTAVDNAGNEIPYNDLFIPNTSMGVDYLLGAVLQVARHDLADEFEDDNFSPLAIFEYDVSDDVMAYASWSKGFKSAGYDVRSNASVVDTNISNPFSSALNVTVDAGSFYYDEEQAESLELGAKSTMLDGSLEVNVAAFYTEYSDLQVSIYDGVLGFNVGNAAEAVTKGIELDGRYAATATITLSGALAWMDFEFQDYENGQCTQLERIVTGITNCDYSGQSNQYVADFSGALSAEHEYDINTSIILRSTLDVIFTTDYNPSQNLDSNIEQDGYTKLNLRVSLSDVESGWEVALVGKNLTDEKIITYANDTPLAANLAQSVGYYALVESPRTIALQGSYRF